MEDLDPEEARAIIDPALKLMIDAVHRYDGDVVQSTGDGHLRAVRAPVHTRTIRKRAVHAAIAARDDLRRVARACGCSGRPRVEVLSASTPAWSLCARPDLVATPILARSAT